MVKRAIVLAQRHLFEGGSEASPAVVALIRRNLTSLAQIGVRDVCIVDGEQADVLRDKLSLHEFPDLRVQVLSNRSWRRASGSALRIASSFLRKGETCLVLRGDRPLDPESLIELASTDAGRYGAAMVVSSPPNSTGNDTVDLSEEVKVRLRRAAGNGEVEALGLDIEDYDFIYTGHALVTPAILDALDGILNPSIEDGLNELVRRGGVRAISGSIAWPWGVRRSEHVDDKVAALLEAKGHPRYTLMNPGPVNTTSRVKSALVHNDISHRDTGFSELLVSLTGRLRRIFRGTQQHSVLMVTGSGTSAMEMSLSSSVPRDRKVLVIDNGAFGERLLEICHLHEMDVVHLRYAWGDSIDPADVERAFERHPDIATVAMIHHETSVGLLNPIREVGAIVRRFDALLIVDAVSSLGAEELDVVRDNIDICYGSANKCLHAVSGCGFVCVSPRAWQKIESIKPRSYYLNLKRYRDYMDDRAQTPFTPAVSSYFALDAACAEFLADGHTKRLQQYRDFNELMRRGLSNLGMFPFTRTGRESHSVVTACVPTGVTFQELYDGLKARGFIVYGCKDVLADKFFQVSNMGDVDQQTLRLFLATAAEVIAELRSKKSLSGAAASHSTRATA